MMTLADSQSASPGKPRVVLPRVLGFTSVVGILIGTVIGSGIFVAPNRIAANVAQVVMRPLGASLVRGVILCSIGGVPACWYWQRRRVPEAV
jgi:hypothetical protein